MEVYSCSKLKNTNNTLVLQCQYTNVLWLCDVRLLRVKFPGPSVWIFCFSIHDILVLVIYCLHRQSPLSVNSIKHKCLLSHTVSKVRNLEVTWQGGFWLRVTPGVTMKLSAGIFIISLEELSGLEELFPRYLLMGLWSDGLSSLLLFPKSLPCEFSHKALPLGSWLFPKWVIQERG